MGKDVEPVSSTGTAEYVKNLDQWRGDARLYKVDPPVDWRDYMEDTWHKANYVVVSGINNEFGVETFIFPADEDGSPYNMIELDGSFTGGIDHARALLGAGYGALFE